MHYNGQQRLITIHVKNNVYKIWLWTHLFANQTDTDRKIQIYTERYKIKHYHKRSHRTSKSRWIHFDQVRYGTRFASM